MAVMADFKKFLTRGNIVEHPDKKERPECTSAIPAKARRCPQCTTQLIGT